MANKQKKCSTCKYSFHVSEGNGDRICQYILIEGHRRPCPGGAECTAYVKAKRAKERNLEDIYLGKE